ncbi:type II toxin-antitoxin system RelE/ParE family toxin [Bizionia arctica]|uniref:Type II toxin-antitoxin system RelE/ParE family toxin n=1 Tax=Bizionia arctica TaxID=1495645 RepID=A0A917GCS9_9FLAO|nr:type II toxin-antitoxin system RelE/ParE family toxin [Bizionia arctica]GGG38387.1 hypothetical protein GCM10010976_07670 [Bizionia arctica]
MKVIWTYTAEMSYKEEIDFILLKWNNTQASLFVELVENNITKLKDYPELGQPIYKNFRVLSISKQTSLFYRIIEENIELSIFWNNKRNPKDLFTAIKY